MPRPAFPDHPMTEKEFKANTRMLAGISTYTIKERCCHDRRYEIDTTSEDAAWQIFEAGDVPYVDDHDEDCTDAEMESVV